MPHPSPRNRPLCQERNGAACLAKPPSTPAVLRKTLEPTIHKGFDRFDHLSGLAIWDSDNLRILDSQQRVQARRVCGDFLCRDGK